ncbi:MAG: alanine--tRNA ligase, partial [Bdellovibrionota bacterium]
FSFGDYFKKDAVAYGWEFVTSEKWLGLNPKRLWITIHTSDDEAEKYWIETLSASGAYSKEEAKDRIRRLGDAENFWQMGDTGPCGPCSEIHYDTSPTWEKSPGGGPGSKEDDGERYLEIWNLVFMQFDQREGGVRTPLPRPSIDTGMGLERTARVLQEVSSNFETDGIWKLIEHGEKLSGKSYWKSDEETRVSLRVLADHARAGTFLIADGVMPGNEGRGYVLRRILRRAIRHAKKLGITKPALYEISGTVVQEMKGAYPELAGKAAFVAEAIRTEEEKFLETLESGLARLKQALGKELVNGTLSGRAAFELYDTFGFPLDLTQTIGEEQGFKVDVSGFDQEMEKQRERSRDARGKVSAQAEEAYMKFTGLSCKFLGYETTRAQGKLLHLLKDGAEVKSVSEGDEVDFVFDQTPFYGESGGQIGDMGVIEGEGLRARVLDTQKPVEGLIVHRAKIENGKAESGKTYSLHVDELRRARIRRNHSATHLLHAALRKTLGTHVTQAGSLVAPDRLRFDFTHGKRLSDAELSTIEDLVNREIERDVPVGTEHKSYDAAVQDGAMALFGEKYGDEVRVVKMGEFSTELCGGTHVSRTGDIRLLRIEREEAVAGGTRRIVAVTGDVAIDELKKAEQRLREVAETLKAPVEDVAVRAGKLTEENRKLQKEISELKRKLATGGGSTGDWLSKKEQVGSIPALIHRADGLDGKSLRELADRGREHLKSGVVVLAGEEGGKALLLVAVTEDLEKKVHAGKIVSEIAPLVGGKGGGKPSFAQAGGGDPAGIEAALKRARELLSA